MSKEIKPNCVSDATASMAAYFNRKKSLTEKVFDFFTDVANLFRPPLSVRTQMKNFNSTQYWAYTWAMWFWIIFGISFFSVIL